MRVLVQRYALVERVGRGGMGEVWRATDRELGRAVAVKVLPPELTLRKEFRVRLRREARVIASLNHRNIAVLHDIGEDAVDEGTTPFLVMEFIEGRTLRDALAEGPFAVERALTVGCDIADALAHSHGHGLIHRDIKPSNVMLTSEGGIKVLDFGIAKVIAETATRLTATGVAVGTPAYLSPEQLMGRPVDGRSDQYSTGCLLYELLTGRPPFVGDSPFAVMHQHVSQEPVPPSRLRPQIPSVVDAVVLRALAKDREQRFGSAGELREALAQAESALVPMVPPSSAATLPAPASAPATVAAGGPGHTVLAAPEPRRVLAERETQSAPTQTAQASFRDDAPAVPRLSTTGGGVANTVDGVRTRPPYGPDPSAATVSSAASASGKGAVSTAAGRLWPVLAGGRTVALLGIVVSGLVTFGHPPSDARSAAVFLALALLGLAVFRWLPLTSALLWWGAGALVIARVAAGRPVRATDGAYVSEGDFDTLYSYDSDADDYYELEEDDSGSTLFEEGDDGDLEEAQGEVSYDYTGHDTVEVLSAPALVLGVLCLLRALRPQRHSVLAAAAGVTLIGLGVSWQAIALPGGRAGAFLVAWGSAVLVALVQELRDRRKAPRPRRRLRLVRAG